MAQAQRKTTEGNENDNTYGIKTPLSANQTSPIDSIPRGKKLTCPSPPSPRRQLLCARCATGRQDGVPLVLKRAYPGITERCYRSATAYPSTLSHRYRLPEHSASCKTKRKSYRIKSQPRGHRSMHDKAFYAASRSKITFLLGGSSCRLGASAGAIARSYRSCGRYRPSSAAFETE